MKPFTYRKVGDLATAVDGVRRNPDARFIAGGTSLLDLMKLGVETPGELLDLNPVRMPDIEERDRRIFLGAMARNSDVAAHDLIRKRCPVLSQALLSGASPQLRNMATIGGNLLQRTRCPYFRDVVTACNKRDPGSGCAARLGYNRTHAIFGVSDRCVATHASDMAVALIALDAAVEIAGSRSVPLRNFYRTPGETPQRETVLERDEVLSAVSIPAIPLFARSFYLKVRDRASFEFALVSAAVALDIDQDRIRSARIALGGVGTVPWRAEEAERSLSGARLNDDAYALAADLAFKDATVLQHNAFKVELGKNTLRRALAVVGDRP